ncbi:MAG TPA: nickel-type superoxide dismutase maturation protease, partial [Thermoplasmata archaeon]|nr:nickel-type superoxide dismutase maturation protease [Thermoplasmata archaeon]
QPFARFRVDDRSMEPTLAPGDYVIVNRWSYKLHGPEQGDIVVARDPETPGRFLVKRVADIANGSVYLVGDNAASSRDSRAFGPVSRSLLVGRVWKTAKP